MGETLEDVFSRLSRKPKDLITELKGLWLGKSRKELPPELLACGLTSKLLTGLQGHLVRELKRKNCEYVHVLLRSFHSALKHQVDEMEVDPNPGVLGRAAEMIVLAFNKLSHEPSVEEQWVDIVNLLASSASLLAVYQPNGLGECMPVLMELSQHQKLGVECRVKVCNAINEVWEVYSPGIKEGMEAKGILEDHCKQWLVSLGKAGDYELQLQILEAVFRVSDAKQRDLLAKMCFKDQQLAIELKSINPKELDVGSRRFLNFLNTVEGPEASVSSVPCLLYQFGDIQLPRPPELDQFWIDFNFGGRSMSTYIEDSWEGSTGSRAEEVPWISVVVKSTNVASYQLQAATDTIVLLVTLKQTAGTLVPSCPIKNDSTLLRLSFHGAHYDQLSQSLEKVFGRVTLLSPSLALSTTTEVVTVQKRKVSQAPVHVLISSKKSYTPVCVVNKLQTPTTADKPPCCNGTPAPEKASVQACLPSNRTAAGTAMSETRVSGDKEGKAPSVPVSPIYSSPVKSEKFTGISANLDATPQGRQIPSCAPKTSTPRKQAHTSILLNSKDGREGETRPRKRGQPQQQLNKAGETPSKHEEVRASRKKVVPLDMRVGKAPRQSSRDSTHQTGGTEHPSGANKHNPSEGVTDPILNKAEMRSKEPRSRQETVTDQGSQPTAKGNVPSKRPALENITNVARDKGTNSAPPRKTKAAKGVTPLEAQGNNPASEVAIELDVIQDSIPKGKKGKATKQTAAKPKYPKEKHPGPHKKHRSPAPGLSRSLVHNLSANTSKCSSTMDKDPYAFDSEDEVPDLPAATKGKKNPGRKWHEEEEELPRVREKKRVYSNKGKPQHSFSLSVNGDSPTNSLNDYLGNTPPPVKSRHVDKAAEGAVTGYKGANRSLNRQNSTSCTHQPQKKPQVARGCKRIRAQPSVLVQSEDSFNLHCNDSSDESYLPTMKETPKTALREQPRSGNREQPQRSCRRSSGPSSRDNARVQPATPAHSQGSAPGDEPVSSAVVRPSSKVTSPCKKPTLAVPSSRKRKAEEPVQMPPRQVRKGGRKGEPLQRALKGNGHGGSHPIPATLFQVEEGELEESPPLSSSQEDEALAKENASPPGGFEDEGISEVVVSLPYRACPQDRDKLTGVVINEQHVCDVGSSPPEPTGLEGDNRKHSEAPQVCSPLLEEGDNCMEGSEPEEGEEEGEKEGEHDVRELTLEFAAICKDVIAHSGDKGKKGVTSTKAAAKQKGRKRVALSKGESTSSKRRKDETPASCRPSRDRAQSAKWTPGLTLATPATEIARFNCRADTTYAKSGRGSYKQQACHGRQSGRGGKKEEFQTTELSPMQPIQFPSLESHSTCSSPHEDSEDEGPSQPGINTQVQQTLQPLAAVMKAKSAAQSMSVWRQADQYQIPRLIFINKMDKQHADFRASLQSIKEKLHSLPLLTQIPIGQGRPFRGVVDLLQMQLLLWEQDKDGSHYNRVPYSEDLQLGLDVDPVQARRDLVEQVASLDDTLLSHIVEEDIPDLSAVRGGHLSAALRRCAVAGRGVLVLCGSALRNRGIQPLMDAITAYLPAPNQRAFNKVPDTVKGPCAFAFKVVYDPQRGPLVFMRIYSGEFRPQTSIYNATRDCKERISRLLLMFADEQREVQSMTEGHIAVAVGLKHTYTGDILVGSSSAAVALRKSTGEEKAIRRKTRREQGKTASPSPGAAVVPSVFQGLVVPEPVFFCTVEPASAAQQKALDTALNCLTHEDPSLRVTTDPDTGQTVLSGMGELHLEIIRDRICTDFKVDATLGRLQVAYRESPQCVAGASAELDRWVGENRHTASCSLIVRPVPSEEGCAVEVKWGEDVSLPQSQHEVQKAVTDSITSACARGPLLAYPIINMCVVVEGVSMGVATSIPMLSACVSECVSKAVTKAGTSLMEPVMNIEVTVPEEHLGTVLGDLSSLRRAQIHEVLVRQEARLVCAHIPLASLVGYSTVLRSLTSGLGSFSSHFSHYAAVGKTLEQSILTQTRGY